ncbi:9390_t:CDS:1, partial [Funneliformis geosporum]
MFIIVQVNEGAKIINGPLVKEVEESSLFSTLFDSIISENYFYQNVCVEVRKTETGPWIPVHEGLK